jgi:hypothetical protein
MWITYSRGCLDKNVCPAVKKLEVVIPASEARRESFSKTKKDSGQAGMTDKELN